MFPLRARCHHGRREKRSLPALGAAALAIGLSLAFAPVAMAQGAANPADEAPAWASRPDSLLRVGEVQQAVRLYRDELAAHGEEPGLHQRLAFALSAMGESGDALGHARRAMELDGGSVGSTMILAQVQARGGDPAAGIATLEKGLEQHPRDQELLETMAQLSLERGRWREAGGLLRELVRLYPGRADYRLDLGRILIAANEFEEAVQQLSEVEAIEGASRGDLALGLGLKGRALLMQGEVEAARDHFGRSRGIGPNAEALGGLGAIAFLEGRAKDAVALFRQALELEPGDADLHYNLGNALARSDQPVQAQAAYRRSLQLEPRNAQAHANLGVLLLGQVEVGPARRHLERALELEPRLHTPHLHLARIDKAQYRYAAALDHYRQYRDATEDEQERARVEGVMGQLREQMLRSEEALARGEMHLLQYFAPDRAQVEELLEQVDAGRDFYVLARRATDPVGEDTVDVGFVDPSGLTGSFSKAVAGLEVGEVAGPVEGPSGWFAFQRVE